MRYFSAAGKVRLATLELAILVLNTLVVLDDGTSCLGDRHLATLMATKEESMMLLRNVFKVMIYNVRRSRFQSSLCLPGSKYGKVKGMRKRSDALPQLHLCRSKLAL